MFERLASLEDEFISLEVSLSDPAVQGDHAELRRVSKRYKDLTPVVECVRSHRERSADAQAARELLVDASESDKEMLRTELAGAEADLADLEEQLRLLMLPKEVCNSLVFTSMPAFSSASKKFCSSGISALTA